MIPLTFYSRKGASGQCFNPDFLQLTEWWDSGEGLLQFGTTNMTGWKFEANENTNLILDEWDCMYTDGSENGYFILK